MYTVKQVSLLTGVTEATLRAWERRYQVVEPTRSPGGYRLYDDAQLALLREMASLVHDGVPASRAAAALRNRSTNSATPSAGAPPDNDELVEAAAALDPIRLRRVIVDAFDSAPFEKVAEEWMPAQLRRIGEAWESGRLSVAQEHFASSALLRAIAVVYSSAPEPNAAQPVLVGLPPGARHDLMLFCFATCLRRLGSAVVYLGADVPVESWLAAAIDSRPRAAVLGVTAPSEVPQAQSIIDKLAHVVPPITVWVGGSLREQLQGAKPLPDQVAQAAALLHRSLVAGGS
ncbi:MerR family transcriptional regulator [Tessaracoccus sp. OS52]|uniref:MerR family transcriptional regulator n=1 Tax=Tessaracoccus sp. OS52 TaxID=2886691 RepID=UPI001D1296F6|nr:MerR family transcriptional regulator [Tessaracoccus sp. OS52]MCC2594102.1 MerR family transcriptional regulator [Tessaracoccus sp. OS52]